MVAHQVAQFVRVLMVGVGDFVTGAAATGSRAAIWDQAARDTSYAGTASVLLARSLVHA